MTARRRVAAPAALAVTVALTACGPGLPDSVVAGTEVVVGWTGEFTSANAAASPTSGNLEIAAATRAGFGERIAGEFVPDEGFGTVTIVRDEPFTVRYDLAEPAWSDDIPLDAADLALAWAAASGLLGPPTAEGTADPDAEAAAAAEPPAGADAALAPLVDEFARAVEVTYSQPAGDWQERLDVAVPAHVVGQRALGITDPMEAKQAVIRAVTERDDDALASLAEVWNDGFSLPDDGAAPADILLSSGPFRVEGVADDAAGQSVRLVPNAAYRGGDTPQVARIDLVPPGEDPPSDLGDRLDVVSVAPTAANREPLDALERRDVTVAASHDGRVWALLLRPAGVFAEHAARAAFLRAVPARGVIERGGGAWASAYTASTSMLSAPGSRAYDIATEDAGFAAALTGPDDAGLEREAAGIAPGTAVCLLYDRGAEFAAGAFAGIRDAAQEAGWAVVDCGADDHAAAQENGGWDAVLTTVEIPQPPAAVAAQWGTDGGASLVKDADPERDALIAELARTTDVYAARDIRAQIEASIVRASVALPLAMNPRVTVVDTDVTGVTARDGAAAPLLSSASQWAVVP